MHETHKTSNNNGSQNRREKQRTYWITINRKERKKELLKQKKEIKAARELFKLNFNSSQRTFFIL